MKKLVLLALCAWMEVTVFGADLAANFTSPPPSARPWVFWFWINGNISKKGITADLEAMKRVGVGGVVWMEVSGPWWAPDGKVAALSPEWRDCIQWAVRECARLGMQFDLSVDFGYGSGGPHITPQLSMQKLYWSQTEVQGGRSVSTTLPKPVVAKNLSPWLRPGAKLSEQVRAQIEQCDSYRDIAVLAIPEPNSPQGLAYRIPDLQRKDGTDWRLPQPRQPSVPPPEAVTAPDQVIDLTGHMAPDGRLTWNAPAGTWLVLRCGHASNYKMTRPCPARAVGLECDRLATAGIDAHYNAFLKPIFQAAGKAAGKTLTYVHVDSWEAGGQNWTATFPAEFRARRGYDLRRWLPVLAGRVVGSAELSERFLWDVRATVSDLIRDNYARRLRQLAQRHGIKLSTEAYGHLCIDNLEYAGVCDLPISEFWVKGKERFPVAGGGAYEDSTKVMASAAHTCGKPIVGAESFTSNRGWRDHPYLLKAMGDAKFCQGLNRMILHLYVHQPYDNMIPGLTHRKWGEPFQRYNTWWQFSRPWMDYLARCQYLLQQGTFVADVCYWVGEGAPLSVQDMSLDLPKGYDFDFCSSEVVLQMRVKNGRIILPSGMSYRYLRLPQSDRMTPPLARKVHQLVEAGARVIGGPRLKGAPGLTDFPRCDTQVKQIADALWDQGRIRSNQSLAEVFAHDKLQPDFDGEGLRYIHRRLGDTDIYFVSNPDNRSRQTQCTFRVSGKAPELWDPETGAIRPLPQYSTEPGRTTVPLRFGRMQSWFVLFRSPGPAVARAPASAKNFVFPQDRATLAGPWEVSFDPKWGGPPGPVTFETLQDWATNGDRRIRYFSGTAVYRKRFEAPDSSRQAEHLFLDLGTVEVMARIRLNGQDCGIAWKPPYRVEISKAIRPGVNKLEISVVNLWINRLIGDEQRPLDVQWKDYETLLAWPDWFLKGTPRPSGRYTFTSCRHYSKSSPLAPSGLLGPVKLQAQSH